jgi:hypothetical protein
VDNIGGLNVKTEFAPFWEMLYLRNVSGRLQLVNEGLRVVKVFKYINNNGIKITDSKDSRENLFEIMKTVSQEHSLGYFPGDRDFFFDLYTLGGDCDLLQFVASCYQNDRGGLMQVPDYLTGYINGQVKNQQPEKILIAEAEKYIGGLKELVDEMPETEIIMTSENHQMFLVLSTYFDEAENVTVKNISIYRELPFDDKFPFIVSIPSFASRLGQDEASAKFQAREPEGIAIENLLEHLQPQGKLAVIVPARITFAAGASSNFRKWLIDNHGIESICTLPEGTFRPYSGIKTYLMEITPEKTKQISIGKLDFAENLFELKDSRKVSVKEFKDHDEWRIELMLAEKLDEIQKYRLSVMPKVKLKEVAEVFRGKSILKDDIKPGEFHVLNISNIENGEIVYKGMDTINEEERKLKRYLLEEGDLLLTCRGTVNKLAVFGKKNKKVLASANIIVIRLKKDIYPFFLKMFLESPVGETLIKSFQRGTTVMNINPNDIAGLEIPMLSMERQQALWRKYREGLTLYEEELKKLDERWNAEKSTIYQSIFEQEA